MYVCLWSPDWSIAEESDAEAGFGLRDSGFGDSVEGPVDLAPLLADLAPRIRVERDVVWADGRGLDAGRLAERLLERLAELAVAARAGVAEVPVAAELAARWGDPFRRVEGPTPFLVKERTGWGWRRPTAPPNAAPDVGEGSVATSSSRGDQPSSPPRLGDPGPATPLHRGVGGSAQSPSPSARKAAVAEEPAAHRDGAVAANPATPHSRAGRGAEGSPTSGEGEGRGNVVVVPVGEEAEWLAGLPVSVLAPPDRLRTLLDGVGVHTLGRLAALEREAVEVRLGAAAVDLWRLARADDRRLLFDRIPPERPHGSLDFVDYVLTDPSRLLFTANALLGPLCDGLVGRGEHARTLRLTLPLANDEKWTRTIRPARPTASRENWLRLIRTLLDRLTVPDAVAGMAIEVGATEEAAVHQGDLFDRGFATAAAVEVAVARLAERQAHPLTPDTTAHPLVERRGGWSRIQDPESRSTPSSPPPPARGDAVPGKQKADPATRAPRDAGHPPGGGAEGGLPQSGGGAEGQFPQSEGGAGGGTGLGLQLLNEPRRITVEVAGRRDHHIPLRLRDRHGWREVVVAAGPDRISGGQWESSSYAREYYRCVTEEGVPLWIYRDALSGDWYLQGWWD